MPAILTTLTLTGLSMSPVKHLPLVFSLFFLQVSTYVQVSRTQWFLDPALTLDDQNLLDMPRLRTPCIFHASLCILEDA